MDVLDTVLNNTNWMTAVLALVVCVVFYVYIQWIHTPPGPTGLPYLGYYPFLESNFHLQLQNMIKKYGKVFCIQCTGQMYVYLGSTQAIKEAHVSKSNCFTERPVRFSIILDSLGCGISEINGETWKEMRKFFVQKFKEFGVGKKTQDSLMRDFLDETVSTLKKTHGENFDALSFFTYLCTRIIYTMLLSGSKRNKDDIMKFSENYHVVTEALVGKQCLLTGPLLSLLLQFHPVYKRHAQSKCILQAELKKIVEEHEKDFDKNNIRDLVDCYINMRKELEEKGDRRSEMYTGKSLQNSLMQFIGDGGHSIGHIISLTFKELCTRPEIQKEMQREINNIVGHNRFPCWDDRSKMPYTNAVIQECFRNTDLFPVAESLQCTKETTVGNCRVPKGAVTLVGFRASFHDPDVYEDPDRFDPTRFLLNDERKPKSELPLYFGVGKRSCIGETIVLMEVFLFVATVLQHFDLHSPMQSDSEATDRKKKDVEILHVQFRATPRVF